jgi:hypothetical protein
MCHVILIRPVFLGTDYMASPCYTPFRLINVSSRCFTYRGLLYFNIIKFMCILHCENVVQYFPPKSGSSEVHKYTKCNSPTKSTLALYLKCPRFKYSPGD